jgi:hypothetical protein
VDLVTRMHDVSTDEVASFTGFEGEVFERVVLQSERKLNTNERGNHRHDNRPSSIVYAIATFAGLIACC